jgi:hypothetical protein
MSEAPTEERASGSDPAFPSGLATGPDGGLFVSSEVAGCGGLSKRELFAAMAMQGMCANAVPGHHHYPPNLAKEAVWQADELLKELAK